MKKFWNLLCVVLCGIALSLGFASCSDDDEKEVRTAQLQVVLNLPADLAPADIEGLSVLLSNDKGQEQTLAVTEDNTVSAQVIQGMYKVTANGKIAGDATGTVVGTAQVDVFADATVTVELSKVYQSPLIFKSIYSTGGVQGYVVDQYYEIVNNSDEVQYLDQLILTAPKGNQKTPNAWQANGYEDLYECGQGQVLAFPGNGTDFPLQPGQSILLVNNADNHKELAKEGNHCPDLTKADWEVYLENVKGETDNKQVPNVEVIFQNNKNMKAWGLGFFGRAYVLARLPKGITPQQYAANKENIMTTPGTASSMEFLMIPSKYVLDAVDILNPDETEHYPTFLPKDDAQGILASAAWQGKCIRRKVTRIENGRPYYQDTNNSSVDFLNNQPLTPGVTPTQVD